MNRESDNPVPTTPQQVNYMQMLPGGICFAHGPYKDTIGCPKWPACATDPQKPEYIAMANAHVPAPAVQEETAANVLAQLEAMGCVRIGDSVLHQHVREHAIRVIDAAIRSHAPAAAPASDREAESLRPWLHHHIGCKTLRAREAVGLFATNLRDGDEATCTCGLAAAIRALKGKEQGNG